MVRSRIVIAFVVFINLCLLIHLISNQQNHTPKTIEPQREFKTERKEDPLMDFANFSYIIEQPPCQMETKGLILIHSAPKNFEKRAVIRETWGGVNSIEQSPLRIMFAFGKSENIILQSSLILEQSLFGDLLQGNFIDSYDNVTYKHVMVLKWFNTYCESAKLLIKLDDDVFINTGKLIENLVDPKPPTNKLDTFLQKRESLLFCGLNRRNPVIRNPNSKWYVSIEEYPDDYYPECCAGFAIIYSPDTVKRLYEEAQKASYFRIDDVYITGTMSKRANITITNLSPFVITESQRNALVKGEISENSIDFLVSFHNIKINEMKSLWAVKRPEKD